jgi:ATP-dependent Clp protease adaptor protein ClpS
LCAAGGGNKKTPRRRAIVILGTYLEVWPVCRANSKMPMNRMCVGAGSKVKRPMDTTMGLRKDPMAEQSDRFAVAPRLAGDDGDGGADGGDPGTGLVTKTREKTKRPALYKVLLLNDDYTPMEFVVLVLERFFNKQREDATQIMLHVHHNGVGMCGVFTYEVAETKVTHVMDFARKHQHPLQCVMEKE